MFPIPRRVCPWDAGLLSGHTDSLLLPGNQRSDAWVLSARGVALLLMLFVPVIVPKVAMVVITMVVMVAVVNNDRLLLGHFCLGRRGQKDRGCDPRNC
jgi:hypothetical protein